MTGSFTTRFGTSPEESAKAPCVASTTANITLSGEQTIDTVAVVANDRVLVRNQTDTTENGIYDASTGTWARSTDFNASDDVVNGILVVDANASNKGIYQAVFTGSYDPGTTLLTFSEILFNTLTSKTGSAGIQAEYNAQGQYLINYMDDLIAVDLTSFVVGETIICNALNVGSPGTYSIWEKVADAQTPPDPATGLNTTDNRWYSALTNATEFKQVRQLSCLTIADLKLIEGTPNQIIEVVSYDAPDFGLPDPYKGNGKFVRDSTSTETDDSATTRTVIQTTGVTTGRWIRVYDVLVDAAGNFTGTDVETALSECATKTTAQTLTNKTLTAPTLASPVLNTGVSGTGIDTSVTTSTTKVPYSNAVKTYTDALFAFRGALVFDASTQSISTSSSTSVTFSSESYDTDSIHDNVTNNSRLTVPVGVTKVRLSSELSWSSSFTATQIEMIFNKNGSHLFAGNSQGNLWDTSEDDKYIISSSIITVTAGDYFEVFLFQNSGLSKDIQGSASGWNRWFAMEIIE